MHFRINLTLIAVLIIVLYFNIPFYNNWLNTNLLNPGYNVFALSKQMEPEQRKLNRFGYTYMVCKEVGEVMRKSNVKDPLVLLPPDEYLKANGVRDVNGCEPAIFYYFTGMHSAWYTSPNVDKANCVLVPDGSGRVMMRQIQNKPELDSILKEFRKYKSD